MTPQALREEAREEAQALLRWWADHAPDERDGFHGEIGPGDRPVADAPRSVILYTRLLWFFSAMASHLASAEALTLADRAAGYLRRHFVDAEHGGLYWLLDHTGQVIDAKKQTYAQAFAVYAFSEYYRASGRVEALDRARGLTDLIEDRFRDRDRGGYIEALTRDWRPAGDNRLSDKDANCPKTMNTHLHVLEAYTRLHLMAPDGRSEAALRHALTVFAARFATGGHLRLFFDMDWTDHTRSLSFGHDIEASWLMWEAALALDDPDLTARVRPVVLALADATLRDGLNPGGGIAYEQGFDGHRDPDGEWWGQAEGLVGFVNAWQMTGEGRYLDAAIGLWAFLKDQHGAGTGGEWTWYATSASRPPVYKAGIWKCPYHNGRAMIELDQRLKALQP